MWLVQRCRMCLVCGPLFNKKSLVKKGLWNNRLYDYCLNSFFSNWSQSTLITSTVMLSEPPFSSALINNWSASSFGWKSWAMMASMVISSTSSVRPSLQSKNLSPDLNSPALLATLISLLSVTPSACVTTFLCGCERACSAVMSFWSTSSCT